ncbi:hypothetical protein [Roseobacter weihaiensis]|uniref:hypothetical protein n=1 Tax=Roseobacter weihaiensis TaxID=2763262 RepID=UPI001D0A9DB0|nr:hypothetical protein [Roseobacter sp. H9]
MRIVRPLALTLIAVFPDASAADMDAATDRAKSKDFNAIGEVLCAQDVGQSLGTCSAAVARVGGCAAVVVTFTNGFARTLQFSDGEFLRGNATMSGAGTDTEWRLSHGLYHVRVDDQRFEIPAALVIGD